MFRRIILPFYLFSLVLVSSVPAHAQQARSACMAQLDNAFGVPACRSSLWQGSRNQPGFASIVRSAAGAAARDKSTLVQRGCRQPAAQPQVPSSAPSPRPVFSIN